MIKTTSIYINSLTQDYSLLKYSRTALNQKKDTVLSEAAKNYARAKTSSGPDIPMREIAKAYSGTENITGLDVVMAQSAQRFAQAHKFSTPDNILTTARSKGQETFADILANATQNSNPSCA